MTPASGCGSGATRPGGLPYLALTGIRKTFGRFVALEGIDLAIEPGEFICFLGPSGCGKTTLLRIIAGLEIQSAGRIDQAGRDVSLLPPAERDYGIVFQSYALFPNLTIADNVGYGLVNRRMPRGDADRRVTELLALVGLPGTGNRYPAQLSGGQQQRVALARALATSPGLLLLDEPLSALDAIVRVRLRNEIRSLQRALGITTIMVTHDQEEALSVADRIVVMNHGVIEQIGTPSDIYREPATPFVADFVGKVNRLDAIAEGDHRYRCGPLRFECPPARRHGAGDRAFAVDPVFDAAADDADDLSGGFRPGAPVSLYLRPEDHRVTVTEGDDAETAGLCTGIVTQVEFLGGNCLARIALDALPDQSLDLQFTLNQMDELRLRTGSPLRFRLRTDRMRVFPAA